MSRLLGSVALVAAIATLVATCPGCDVPSVSAGRFAEDGWIVTRTPADRDDGGNSPAAEAPTLDDSYPTGSRIAFVGAVDDDALKPRVLSGDLAAAGAPSLTLDGSAVLFAGRASASSGWAIYLSRLDTAEPRIVLRLEGDCGGPRELAHHRLVAACRTPGSHPIWSLYTAGLDGSDPERITFGPGSAIDPLPLRDGRILFSMEQEPGPGRPSGGAFALFTLNPDGTMLEPFSGSHRPPAFKLRARQTYDDGVVYLASDHPRGGEVERIEMRQPQAAPTAAWSTASGELAPWPLEVSAVEPLPDGDFLVAGSAPGATSAIYRISSDGRTSLLFDDPEWDEVEAISSRPAPPLRGRPSGRQPGRDTATLVCYDVARGDGEIGPAAGASTPPRVAVDVLRSGRSGGPDTAIALGETPVHDDGSFQVEVPTDVPIRVRSLDADGVELARSDWFWMRPGEVRACFGCHEDRASAPVNRTVRALADPATALYAGAEVRSR